MVWYSIVWYSMVWYSMEWYDSSNKVVKMGAPPLPQVWSVVTNECN